MTDTKEHEEKIVWRKTYYIPLRCLPRHDVAVLSWYQFGRFITDSGSGSSSESYTRLLEWIARQKIDFKMEGHSPISSFVCLLLQMCPCRHSAELRV